MTPLSPQEELILLKKRSRRRLVGASVLVACAIVLLWRGMGFSPESPVKLSAIEVVAVPEEQAASLKSPRFVDTKADPLPESRPSAKKTPVDPALLLAGAGEPFDLPPALFVIQLAALSDSNKVEALRSKLDTLGLVANISQAKTAKGTIMRVRVGPFETRKEAQITLKSLAQLGIKGLILEENAP